MDDDFVPRKPKPDYFAKEHNNKKSRKQENILAKKIGGKRQKASGAVTHHRGDVSCKEILFEAKRTDKESLSIKKEWLSKISKEALMVGKVPGFSFEIGEAEQLIEMSWTAVPTNFFQELLECYRAMGEKKTDEDEGKKD